MFSSRSCGRMCFGFMIFLSSCANQSPPLPDKLISTGLLLNSLKCGFALALEKEERLPVKYRRLKGNVATLELTLKIADTNTKSAGADGTIGIIPWQGSILPSLSYSNSGANTVNTVLNSSYKLDATNDKVCDAAGVRKVNGQYYDPFGFSRWLGDIIADLAKVSPEKPTGQLDKLTYDATFAVTQSTEFKAGLKLAFLNANVGDKIDRVDTQEMKIVISGAPAKEEKPGKTDQAAKPPRSLGPAVIAPRLSTIEPSLQ